MRSLRRVSSTITVLFLLGPAVHQGQGAGGQEATAFLRAVGDHFGISAGEVAVLSRWRLPAGEIPVVLYLADRAGVSPDVVVAQRRRGESWMAIAGAYSVHAGDFHVQMDGPPGVLAGTYERFNGRSASEWRGISLSDDEVVALVNVRFLSRFLRVSPARVAQELGGGRGMVDVFQRLGGGGR